MANQNKFVFEASWEVCHKVGGIYTVVKSKAALLNDACPNYFLVGPYFQEMAEAEFEEDTLPHGFGEAFDELKKEGIICHFGHWLIKGNPKTILIDFFQFRSKTNDIKGWLWDNYKVDSLGSSGDFDEAVVWAYAAGKMIEKVIRKKEARGENDTRFVAHFHEWLAGTGLLYLKKCGVKIGTIFTTHATMLGRTVAGMGRDLYEQLENINPDEEAKALGVQSKHLTEKACATTTDVFTTVSEITAIEAEHLLSRKA
ncbi:glycogen/starch synthase, partial [Candidatus Woesearchaeota archaeon]|nr:glycogen/starch synthase [Candidatus Woesearchaeota archaeon]